MQAFSNFISMTPLPPKATFEKYLLTFLTRGTALSPLIAQKLNISATVKKLNL